MKREFSDPEYGSFSNKWADFFINLGEYVVSNLAGNSRIILLTPSTKIIPFLISLGAARKFLDGNISTGFHPIEDIWGKLQNTKIGTEIHVIDKTRGFIHYKGALSYIDKKQFNIHLTQNRESVSPGWMYTNDLIPDIDISIVEEKEFVIPSKSTIEKGDPNLNLLGKFYEGVDPLGVLGLPNNLIQLIGNKNTLLYESKLEFTADGIKGSMSDLVISKGALSNTRELTYIGSGKEENLKNESNLSIFVQSKNVNISNLIDWTNNFPQVFIINRSSPSVAELVELFNDEYLEREESFSIDLDIPLGCEIMSYGV